jgi:hypothetical protein
VDPWQSNLYRLGHRVRALGLRHWLTLERDAVRLVVKTALAATLAWELARVVLGSRLPALAALAAILTVQVTVRQTVARGLQQVVGVVVGVVAAVALARYLGVHAWSVGLVILASLLLGRLLRLGTQANQVAISGLLVLSLGTGYGADRVWDTLLGAAVGVIVNMLVVPPTYLEAAETALRGVGADLGLLLTEVGGALARGDWDARVARGWLERARELNRDQRDAAVAVAKADESVQFNPRARAAAESVARLTEAVQALDHAATQTRGIARTLLELRQSRPEPSAAAVRGLARYGELLSVLGTAVAAFGRLQSGPAGPDAAVGREELIRAHAAGQANRDLVEQAMTEVPAADAIVSRTLGALLVDADRLLHEIDPVRGAHTAAVPPPSQG